MALLGPKHVPTTTPTTTDVRPKHVPTTTPITTDVHAKHDPITKQTTNYVSENSTSTQELPYNYEYSVDPNDSYATIRIWCDKKAVLSVSSDEAIDNSAITIVEPKDGVFEKLLTPRYEIAHNQHWNSSLLLSFIIHQFHKVIIQFHHVFTPNHCVFHTSLFAPKHLPTFLTGVYTFNNALNHDFFFKCLLWLCIHKLKGILRNRTVLMPTT